MNSKERMILIMLACVQFSHIMDFMILMPLGPQLMEKFKIDPRAFSLLVAAYSLGAFISNISMSFIADRYDRKTLLLILFGGFLLGTFGCACSDSYLVLLVARFCTGVFGGLLSAIVFSIVGDLIPLERRASAMGIVMGGFSAAAVLGVPAGIYFSTFNWHYPFLLIVAFGLVFYAGMFFIIPQMRKHLELNVKTEGIFKIFQGISERPDSQKALLLSLLLLLGQFMVIPFIATYFRRNLGYSDFEIIWVYLIGGMATIFTAPRVGKLADKLGKNKVFVFMGLCSIFPLLAITHLPDVPLIWALPFSTLFFIFIGGRTIPANAIIVSTVPPHQRGGFMNINSSVINLGSGLANLITGMIVIESADGRLLHYNIAGYVAVFFSLIAVYVGSRIRVSA